MIFVLAGTIGYLYWQQTRIIQHIQSLSIIVSSLVTPPPAPLPETEAEPETEEQIAEVPMTPEDEDDRVSVEHVSGPPEPETATTVDELDVDDLQSKTKVQLHKLLTDKGIPYAKSDNKTQLIELLKATA